MIDPAAPIEQLRFAVASYLLGTDFDPMGSLPLVAARLLSRFPDPSGELVQIAAAANYAPRSELQPQIDIVCQQIGLRGTAESDLVQCLLPHWVWRALDPAELLKYSAMIYRRGFTSGDANIEGMYAESQWTALIAPFVLGSPYGETDRFQVDFGIAAREILGLR